MLRNGMPERLVPWHVFLRRTARKKKPKCRIPDTLTAHEVPSSDEAGVLSVPTLLPRAGGPPRAQRSGSSRSMSELGWEKLCFYFFTSFQLECSIFFDYGTEATNYSSVSRPGDVLTSGIRDIS